MGTNRTTVYLQLINLSGSDNNIALSKEFE